MLNYGLLLLRYINNLKYVLVLDTYAYYNNFSSPVKIMVIGEQNYLSMTTGNRLRRQYTRYTRVYSTHHLHQWASYWPHFIEEHYAGIFTCTPTLTWDPTLPKPSNTWYTSGYNVVYLGEPTLLFWYTRFYGHICYRRSKACTWQQFIDVNVGVQYTSRGGQCAVPQNR